MAPRGRPTRTTRSRPVTATPPPVTTTPPPVTDPTTTTSVTSAQLQAMIDEGVTAVLAAVYDPIMATIAILGNRTVTNDVAYAMTWSDLKKKMTTKYCPRNEIKKIEAELWNLKVQGTDVVAYNQCFQELALLSDRMFPEETDKIERYVGGMPDLIYSSVVASKPKTMQEAIEMATELMDRRINTLAERTEQKRRGSLKTSLEINTNPTTYKAYAVGVAGQNPDHNVVTAPTTLDHGYNVELADGRIIWVNTVLLGCTLNFLNHPFHVDLMPVEMGTYDVIIGMDWLTKYQAVIDCAKKIAQKYVLQGCHVFLAHITIKETGDKSKKKASARCTNVKINFPEVFPDGLCQVFTYQKGGISPRSVWNWMTLFDPLQGSSGLSKIDLRSGYHQFKVREGRHLEDCLQNSIWNIMNSKLCRLNKKEHEEHLKIDMELFEERRSWHSCGSSKIESVKDWHSLRHNEIRQFFRKSVPVIEGVEVE
ncbi:putative reverse transcriptase domain-containing protein [Tanacetum coccineum]